MLVDTDRGVDAFKVDPTQTQRDPVLFTSAAGLSLKSSVLRETQGSCFNAFNCECRLGVRSTTACTGNVPSRSVFHKEAEIQADGVCCLKDTCSCVA